MKILLFSDVHLAEHEDFSYLLPDGEQSRLTDLLKLVERIPVLAEKYGCDLVIMAGDLFHQPRTIDTRVYQRSFAVLERVAERVKRLILLAGNHDLALFQHHEATALYPLKRLPNTFVILHQTEVKLPGRTLLNMMPFLDNRKDVREALKTVTPDSILVSHCGLTEAVAGPNEIMIDAPLSLDDLEAQRLRAAFFGHYHSAQQLDQNVFVIGALAQHNMLDRGQRRGILIYDTDTGETRRVWLRGPQFFLREIASADELSELCNPEMKGGYVRVLLRTQAVDPKEVAQALTEAGAERYQVRHAVKRAAAPRNAQLTDRLLGGGLDDALEDYVQHIRGVEMKVGTAELEPGRLVHVGRELLQEYDEI